MKHNAMYLYKQFPKCLVLFLVFSFFLTACNNSTSEERSKNTKTIFKVATIAGGSVGVPAVDGTKNALKELGYVEGENIQYVSFAFEEFEELDSIMQSVLDEKVDLIFAAGSITTLSMIKERIAGTNIPLVFGTCGDPVAEGLIDNLQQPGENMTGVTCTIGDNQSEAKRLEFLLQMKPDLERVYVPYNPENANMQSAYESILGAAAELDVEVVTGDIRSVDEYKVALENFPDDVDAIFLLPSHALGTSVLPELLAMTFEKKVLLSTVAHFITENGAIMSYSPDFYFSGTQGARLVDQVLKGADAGTIPIEAAEILLAINLKTAEAIGLEVPESLLEQADIIYR